MSPTRKATTAHGEVEYETVECDSCGNEVKKESAEPFTVGEYNHREGYACQFCLDDGVASFPDRVKGLFTKDPHGVSFGEFALLAILYVPVITSAGLSEKPSDESDWYDRGFAHASIIFTLYILLALLVWWLL